MIQMIPTTPDSSATVRPDPGGLGLLAFVDVVVLLMAAPFVIVMGAPVLGYAVGAGAWCLGRAGAEWIERRAAATRDARRFVGMTIASSMGRVWLLALVILAVGEAVTRRDGLAAALAVAVAFTIQLSMKLVLRSLPVRPGTR
jgi:hypothetical protein